MRSQLKGIAGRPPGRWPAWAIKGRVVGGLIMVRSVGALHIVRIRVEPGYQSRASGAGHWR